MVYTLPIPLNYDSFDINHLKMMNIMVSTKIWANKELNINCDNLPVVEVLNSGRVIDEVLAICARNIWLRSALCIHISVQHVAGSKIMWHICYLDRKIHKIFTNYMDIFSNPQWVLPHTDLMLFNSWNIIHLYICRLTLDQVDIW